MSGGRGNRLRHRIEKLTSLEGAVSSHIENLREYRQAVITAAITRKIDLSKETLWLTQALLADLFFRRHRRTSRSTSGKSTPRASSSRGQPVSRSYKLARRAGARCRAPFYATSVHYQHQPDAAVSEQFFATVHNRTHSAAHGHTTAEIVFDAAGDKPLMRDDVTTEERSTTYRVARSDHSTRPTEDPEKVEEHGGRIFFSPADVLEIFDSVG